MSKDRIIRRFESLTAYLDYAEPDKGDASSRKHRSDDWAGCDSFADAMELARHGWSEERPATDSLIENLKGSLSETIETAFEPVYDSTGGTVDVAAFLNGEPECMVRFEIDERSADREVVKILVSGSTNAGTSAEVIRRRGICVCALLDLVAATGKSVELWTECSVRNGAASKTITCLVKVKDSTAYLDVDQVMYAMAHPSFLRRITFSAWEQENKTTRNAFHFNTSGNYSYPSPLLMGEEVGAHIKVETLDYRNQDPFKTIEGMIGWVRQQLKQLNLLKEG